MCTPSAGRFLLTGLAVTVLIAAGPARAQAPAAKPAAAPEPPPLDPKALREALAARPAGEAAAALADKLRRWFGAEGLRNGTARSHGLEVAFALEAEGARSVTARSLDGLVQHKLEPVGAMAVWATVQSWSDGTALRVQYEV